jgi:hypothetical protein
MVLVSRHMLNQGDYSHYISSVPVVIFCVLKSGPFLAKTTARPQMETNHRIVSGEEMQDIAGEARISKCDQVATVHGPGLSVKKSPMSPSFAASRKTVLNLG